MRLQLKRHRRRPAAYHFAMDKLDAIFTKQAQLDRFIAESRNLDYDTETWLQKQVLAMISELGEVLDEVNFKWWKNPKEVDSDRVREELVDILHFLVSMCLRSGMDAKELYERYMNKNKTNFDRQFGQGDKDGYSLADK